jgi:hypothetical protein
VQKPQLIAEILSLQARKPAKNDIWASLKPKVTAMGTIHITLEAHAE